MMGSTRMLVNTECKSDKFRKLGASFVICLFCLFLSVLVCGCGAKQSDSEGNDCKTSGSCGENDEESSCEILGNCEEDIEGTNIVDPSRKWTVLSDVGVSESSENIDSLEARLWEIQLPDTWSTDTVKGYCQNLPGQVEWAGNPSEHGASAVIFHGTKSQLEDCLKSTPGALFAEESIEVQASGLLLNNSRSKSERRLQQQRVDSRLWGLDRIDAEVGLDQTYDNLGITGDGVHVYVLDTGIRTSHDEFQGRAIPELDVTSFPPQRCNGDPNCALDRNGHGTHCAGTVAGRTVGVAKQARVHAIKVLGDDGSGSTAGIVAAIDFVASEGQRPAVISMSLGCSRPCQSRSEASAIQAANRAGVTVVVAAGNDGNTDFPDACSYAPASIPLAITVGSITINNDQRSSFSNIGSCVDIFAPGSAIFSASHRNDVSGATLSGTSMACPHVSGVAALALSKDPTLDPSQVTDAIVSGALVNKVRDARGSPNKLLFIGNLPNLGGSTTEGPSTTTGPKPPCLCIQAVHPTFGEIPAECGDHVNDGDNWCYVPLDAACDPAPIPSQAISGIGFQQCPPAQPPSSPSASPSPQPTPAPTLAPVPISTSTTNPTTTSNAPITTTLPTLGTITPTTPNPQEIRFVAELSQGRCSSFGGFPINDEALCIRAASVLGVPDITISKANARNRPEGCYVFRGNRLFMGVNPASRGKGAETSTPTRPRHPICGFTG